MDTLGLTPDAIGERVGVDPATIRKFQGSPAGQLGAESRARLLAFYREVATAKNIPIDEPPSGFIAAGSGIVTDPGSAELIAALTALVEELRAERRERADLLDRVGALETAAKLRDQQDAEDAGTRPLPPVNAQ